MKRIYINNKIRSSLAGLTRPGLGLLLALMISFQSLGQNYVFSGAEAVNFGSIALTTSTASPYWGTDRSASPGYYSAVGTATYTNAADVNYNIKGYVKWYANAAGQSFTAPVGDEAQLRNLTISGSTANGDIFATAWWTGSPSTVADPTGPNAGTHLITSVGPGVGKVSAVGFWDWQDISGTANGRTVTVDIPDMTAFATAANLRLVGWNGTQWVILSASATATGNTNHSTLTGTMIAGITSLAVGAVAADLTPFFTVSPNQIVGPSTITSRIRVLNLSTATNATSGGTITVRILKSSLWSFVWNSAATSNSLGVLNNSVWTYTSNVLYHIWTTTQVLAIGSSRYIGFDMSFNPGATSGQTAVTTQIVFPSGGETNDLNNTDSETIIYSPLN